MTEELLVWEEPPDKSSYAKAEKIEEMEAYAKLLQQRPGAWAIVKTVKSTSGAHGFINVVKSIFPQIKFTVRKKGQVWCVYARFTNDLDVAGTNGNKKAR